MAESLLPVSTLRSRDSKKMKRCVDMVHVTIGTMFSGSRRPASHEKDFSCKENERLNWAPDV